MQKGFTLIEKMIAVVMVMILGLVVAGAPLVIAVFAAVLQRLLRNAIDMKSENDLTV